MEVILIYECAGCDRLERIPIPNVSVRDQLALDKRLPEGWVVQNHPTLTPVDSRGLLLKKGEAYFCPTCAVKTK